MEAAETVLYRHRSHASLVDAGISCKRIDTGVQELGIKPDELAGVLITHEHSDHISGIRVFSKKHQCAALWHKRDA